MRCAPSRTSSRRTSPSSRRTTALGAEVLGRRAGEALTAIEQLCHVRDIEIDGYQRRIERTLAEDNPFLPAIDTDALARDRRYGESNADEALSGFSRGAAPDD